jgi:hypothetical protein
MPLSPDTNVASSRQDVSRSWLSWMMAIGLLTLAGTAINAYISYQFFERNVYYYMNTVFDTDPDSYTWLLLGHPFLSRRHPLMVLVAIPFSSIGAALATTMANDSLRMWIPLLFGPVISGCRTIFLMLGLRYMKCPLWWASLIAVVEIVSFSRLVMGSEPESFALSSTLFCGLFYLTARYLASGRFVSAQWISAGVLLGGVTITNIVPYTLVMFLLLVSALKPMEAMRVTIRTAGLAVAVMAVLYGLMAVTIKPRILQRGAVASSGLNSASPGTSGIQIDALEWLVFQPGRIAKMTPLLNTYVFTGPPPLLRTPGVNGRLFPGHPVPRVELLMPEEYGVGWLMPLALVSCMLVLGIAGWMSEFSGRVMALANLTVIAFQLSLHSFWGSGELFLYVMHWQIALVFLMAGSCRLTSLWRAMAVTICIVLIGTEAILNTRNLAFMLAAL